MTAGTPAFEVTAPDVVVRRPPRFRWQRVVLHLFLITLSIVWLAPILWSLFQALRPYGDVIKDGYVVLPKHLTLDNFAEAWKQGDLGKYFINTIVIAFPAVVITLWVSSMLGFVFSRFSFRANILLLMLFTAGNLLPQQVIIVPLYRIYLALPNPLQVIGDAKNLYDSYFGIGLIHIVFQTGFCTFVLSNYMKTLSKDLTEAALVDGASLWMIYRKVVLPLSRPALAALAVLEFTFIYNDFFWAVILMFTGAKRPITSALNNFQGAFFTDQNVLAAMSFIVVIPTVVVYLILSKQFVRGLTLGSTKG
jgi:multiple sugar transport system permease protein